jgi:hypothetical protein
VEAAGGVSSGIVGSERKVFEFSSINHEQEGDRGSDELKRMECTVDIAVYSSGRQSSELMNTFYSQVFLPSSSRANHLLLS